MDQRRIYRVFSDFDREPTFDAMLRLPIEIPLSGFAGEWVTFPSITGQVSPGVGGGNDADGGVRFGGVTNVLSTDGVSGLIHDNRTMFLAGVFLGPLEPESPAPARLNVTTLATETIVAPMLRQSFFIGDGLTGTGSGTLQRFLAPTEATRLCLGFVEAASFLDASGHYDDNSGQLTVAVAHSSLGNCPCRAENYCVTTQNSTGGVATISGLGPTSVAHDDFRLVCQGFPGGVPGLFFYGAGQVSSPFANGVRCVSSPCARFPLLISNGQGDVELILSLTTPPQHGCRSCGSHLELPVLVP